jgi:hypothetical protein
MRSPLAVAAGVGAVVGLAWLGLQIPPPSFPPYPEPGRQLETVTPPADVPVPVARFFGATFPKGVPTVESAVMTGRGTLRFGPVTFPMRFRFTHEAGRSYRHYFELTWFGLPVMRANEWFVDERARLELPFGIVAQGPKTDSAANLGLWAETALIPSVYATDRRLRWEPVDEQTARLIMPAPAGEDGFTVGFDPRTGRIARMEAMRYRDEADAAKLPWRTESLGLRSGTATWGDQAAPWLQFTVEEIVVNADVSGYVRGKGL